MVWKEGNMSEVEQQVMQGSVSGSKKAIAPDPLGRGDARETPGALLGALAKPKIGSKDTNPKDAVGIKKWRQFTTVPCTVLWELGVAMLEGARKYGRHNYRVAGVRGSVYIDAARGHLDCWWEGEDTDPDSGLSHIVKAIASLTVLRDAMIQDKFVDDRPPKTKNLEKVKANLQAVVDRIFEDIPEPKDAFLEGDQYK